MLLSSPGFACCGRVPQAGCQLATGQARAQANEKRVRLASPAWFMAALVAGQRHSGKLAKDWMLTTSIAHLQPQPQPQPSEAPRAASQGSSKHESIRLSS